MLLAEAGILSSGDIRIIVHSGLVLSAGNMRRLLRRCGGALLRQRFILQGIQLRPVILYLLAAGQYPLAVAGDIGITGGARLCNLCRGGTRLRQRAAPARPRRPDAIRQ